MTHEEALQLSTEYYKRDGHPQPELAAKVMVDKYLLRDKADNILEATPEELKVRIVKAFYEVERRYEDGLTYDEIYREILNTIYPQGSGLMGIGNPFQLVSLSNCFVVASPEDSISSIFHAARDIANIMKRRGGVGVDLSELRPEGARVNNAARTSTGAWSFADFFSAVSRLIGQEGRRGAEMISLDIRHPDALKFIKMKEDLTKVTGANVSLKVTDDFMEAVVKREKYVQHWPIGSDDPLVEKEVDAYELFWELADAARRTAEPGILFVDEHDRCPAALYWDHLTTNPCVTPDTPILTDKGYTPIIETVGQKVNVWNGEGWSEVEPRKTGENQPVVTVELSNGRSITCTDYHGFILEDGTKVEAENLKVGDRLAKCEFPVISGQVEVDAPYTQGFYAGDGTVNTALIQLYGPKVEIADFMAGDKIGDVVKTHTGMEMQKFKLGFRPKAKNWVPNANHTLQGRLDWFAGLLDADGHELREGGVQLTSIDRDFLLQTQLMLQTCGVDSKVRKERGESVRPLPNGRGGTGRYKCKSTYRLQISAFAMQRLVTLGLHTHRLTLDKTPNRDASRFVTVTSITDAGNSDVYCFTEPKLGRGVFNGILTANCGELYLNAYDSCRLMYINLVKFVKDGVFDFDALRSTANKITKLNDSFVTLELEAVNRIQAEVDDDSERDLWRKVCVATAKGRRLGIGETGYGDALALCGLKYGTPEAVSMMRRIKKTIAEEAYATSAEMAYTRGSFPAFDAELERSKESFLDDIGYAGVPRRNVALLTNAPVGTGSIIAGNVSSGIEPVFMYKYTRRVKLNHSDKTSEVDFVDQNGDKWVEHEVRHWTVEGMEEIPEHFVEAGDIPYKERLASQAAVQDWNDHSVSSTLNLPADTTTDYVLGVYLDAWEQGLKGVTVYVDGSRSGVLIGDKQDDRPKEIPITPAPRRPEVLEAVRNGDVVIGLYDGKPYEVFILKDDIKGGGECSIRKEGGDYLLSVNEHEEYYLSSLVDVEMNTFARLLSLSLRHGSPLHHVVEQLGKDPSPDFYSISKRLARILKEYIEDGVKAATKVDCCESPDLVYENGCVVCRSCGNSKCG